MKRSGRIVRELPAEPRDPRVALTAQTNPASSESEVAAHDADAIPFDEGRTPIEPAEVTGRPTPIHRNSNPNRGSFVRELRELTAGRPESIGQLGKHAVRRPEPQPETAQVPQPSEQEKADLIRELVELARTGAQRDIDRVREQVADDISRFRNRPDDMPI